MLHQLALFVALLAASFYVWAEQGSAQQLEAVQSEITQINKDLSAKKADKEALYKQLQQQTRKISDINKKLSAIKNGLAQNEQKLANLEQQHSEQKSVQQQQTEALFQQLRDAYIHTQSSYLKMLLNQNDPAKLARATTYYNYFHQARQNQLDQIQHVLANLTDQQKQIFALQKQQQQRLAEQQQQHAALQKQNEKRKQTLAKINNAISSQGERLANLQKQEQSLLDLLNSLNKQQKTVPKVTTKPNFTKFSGLKGDLAWPTKGKLLARYGSKRNLGTLTWKGIMISAPTGKEVSAVANGEVVFADWLRGFGLLIIINHGDQYMTLYGNNETLLREVGDVVSAGDVIAQSGPAGMHKQAGLYFEIRHKGDPKNPLKWLNKRG